MISSDDKGFKSRWFEEMEIPTRRLFFLLICSMRKVSYLW
jgi:hypothetical protein